MTRPPATALPADRKTACEAFLDTSREETGFRHHAGFVVAALVIHAALFLVAFPVPMPVLPEVERTPAPFVVKRPRLAPPAAKPPEQRTPRKPPRHVIPLPDPPPIDHEPELPGFELPAPVDVADTDIEFFEPDVPPGPPEPTGPLLPGHGGVTFPERLTMVEPSYPPLARRIRAEGRVTLRAVVRKDGTVARIEVLSAPRVDVGFSEAAVEAVSRWTYRPATRGGRPVDVYLTVVVNFALD